MKFLFEERRLVKLVAGMFACTCAAICFSYSLMTNEMKERFHMTQGDLTTVTTVATVVGSFAIPAGYLFDRFGPKPVLVICALSCGIAFGGLALSFAGLISTATPVLCFWFALMSFPGTWIDVGGVMTNLFNFPLNNGDVIMLQKTFMGVGTAMLAACFNGWFDGQYAAYCVFQALVCLIFLLLAAWLIDLPNYVYVERRMIAAEKDAELLPSASLSPSGSINSKDSETPDSGTNTNGSRPGGASKNAGGTSTVSVLHSFEPLTEEDHYLLSIPADRSRIRIGFILLVLLVLFLSGTSLLFAYDPATATATAKAWVAGFTVVLGASFWSLPLLSRKQDTARFLKRQEEAVHHRNRALSHREKRTFRRTLEKTESHEDITTEAEGRDWGNNGDGGVAPSPNADDADEEQKEDTELLVLRDNPEIQYDDTILQSLRKPDLWLMWWVAGCVWGSGAVIVINAAQIYRSINDNVFHSEMMALLMTFLGLGSAAGRIGCGACNQHFLQPRGHTNSWLYIVAPTCMAVALLLFLFIPADGLLFPFALSGFAYGWSWAAAMLLARRLYRRDVGKHYNFVYTALMVSVVVLNRYVFGSLFDEEARAQGRDIHCTGVICVRVSQLVLAALCASAALAAIIVHVRWLGYLRKVKNGSSSY